MLTVYKASAGSGKTFTLAVEYICLLINNPDDYRTILAVTFTNKATQEMKWRIISQLYGIAKGLPSSDAYLEQVALRTHKPVSVIRSHAAASLSLLTHKYNNFRVQTIDAFFQSVLRNLARELDLTANLRIDLNDIEVEQRAIDQMVRNLDHRHDVLTWISDYIDDNIAEDKNWNVIKKIKEFGKNIFEPFYKDHEDELARRFQSPEFFKNYTDALRLKRDRCKSSVVEKAMQLRQLLIDRCVYEPSYYNRSLYPFIRDLCDNVYKWKPIASVLLRCVNEPSAWAASKCPAADKNVIVDMAANGGCELLGSLIQLYQDNWAPYQSSILVLENLSKLRLLMAIANAVTESNKEANRFLLSDTQSLLHGLMKDSDTPFVFEKIGSQLKHMMIDEFQDTSRLQWSNFKKLLANCMAQAGSHDLIVGDVKQSIYRWRQGDWRLLNNIEEQFDAQQIEIKRLSTNYRSCERVITFNNTFFPRLVDIVTQSLAMEDSSSTEELKKAYGDVAQKAIKPVGSGYVEVALLPDADFEQQVLERLVSGIRKLIEAGVAYKDIAILVRSNKDIPSIADCLIRSFSGKVPVVSDEAFRLDSSTVVKIIIYALHLLTHPTDDLVRAQLVKAYQQQILGRQVADTALLVSANQSDAASEQDEEVAQKQFKKREELNQYLPQDYVQHTAKLRTMPLVDLVDNVYSMFHLERMSGQSAYVCTFYDVINNYLADHASDINDFLDEWEAHFSSKTIQSVDLNGIRVITIHKSKGLEFPYVFMPFCNWKLELDGVLWCEGQHHEAPFDVLPITPVRYSSSLKNTVYKEEYALEHFQCAIDNLNMLYVAFTRAERHLYVIGKRMKADTLKKKKKDPNFSDCSQEIEMCLPLVHKDLEDSELTGVDEANQPLCFTMGTPDVLLNAESKSSQKQELNPFNQIPQTLSINVETFPKPVTFLQSNESRNFVGNKDGNEPSATYINIGNVLHQLFAHIYTTDDVALQLRQMEEDGILDSQPEVRKQLFSQIQSALSQPLVNDWFSSRWQVFNECTVLEYDEETGVTVEHRPDRVMCCGDEWIVVDFKFGKPHLSYHQQVKRYMRLLSDMGHSQIKGYLWYVLKGRVDEVLLD